MKLFLDDFSVYSDEATHLEKLRKCFEKCREFGISLNPEISMFLVHSGIILGYIVSKEGKFPDTKKIQVVVNLPRSKKPEDIQVFNNIAQFNRTFIKDIAFIMAPITKLLRKKEDFQWTPECQAAFDIIKARYTDAPILIAPKWNLEFHVHIDASDIAVGAMLGQNHNGKHDQPISYASRLLNSAERNYTNTEREVLAMVYAINKFRHYLMSNLFVFFVDHMALVYLVNKPHVSGRIARWLLLFLEFDFKVVYKPGKTHHMADALSRLPKGEPPDGIPDQTADATLFSTKPIWLQEVSAYLTTGLLSLTMSLEDRKRLVWHLNATPFQHLKGSPASRPTRVPRIDSAKRWPVSME